MARLLSPAGWFAATIAGGSRLNSAAGAAATVYAASTGSTLADIASWDGTNTPGPSIAGSTLTVDSHSEVPRFWLPDGASTVWVQVGTGPRVEVGADPGARLDRLEKSPVNVCAYGAQGNGTADDTTAIANALSAAGSAGGGIVYVPPGTYRTSSPLSIPDSVALQGAGWHEGTATVIKPLAGFSGTEVLLVDDGVSSYIHARISGLKIDGSAGPAGVDGILIQGKAIAALDDVRIASMTGNGITVQAVSTRKPLSLRLREVMAYQCGGVGFSFGTGTDSTLVSCYALGCTGDGFALTDMANSRFIGCQAEWCATGFHITGGWFTGTGSGGAVFSACSTDRNTGHGVLVDSTGNGPVELVGLMLRRDGRNGGSGGGGYAGLAVVSATSPVRVTGITCYPGVDDDGTQTNSPQYGISASGAASVHVTSGYVHAATTAINDGGSNTTYVVTDVTTATGTTASPTLTPANIDVGGRALGIATPRDHGLVAWTADPAACSSSAAPNSGDVILCAIYVPRIAMVTKIYWTINTAGSGAVAGQNFVGLYNSSGTKLVATGVDASVTTAATIATTISSTTLTPGFYWIAFVFNATTRPTIARSTALAQDINVAGQTAASYRFARAATGQTSLPASITPGSNGTTQNTFWAAVA